MFKLVIRKSATLEAVPGGAQFQTIIQVPESVLTSSSNFSDKSLKVKCTLILFLIQLLSRQRLTFIVCTKCE